MNPACCQGPCPQAPAPSSASCQLAGSALETRCDAQCGFDPGAPVACGGTSCAAESECARSGAGDAPAPCGARSCSSSALPPGARAEGLGTPCTAGKATKACRSAKGAGRTPCFSKTDRACSNAGPAAKEPCCGSVEGPSGAPTEPHGCTALCQTSGTVPKCSDSACSKEDEFCSPHGCCAPGVAKDQGLLQNTTRGPHGGQAVGDDPAGTVRTRIHVAGLCCPTESQLIMRALGPMPGVTRVDVSVPSRTVVVLHDPALAPPPVLLNALNSAHLGATLKRHSGAQQSSASTAQSPSEPGAAEDHGAARRMWGSMRSWPPPETILSGVCLGLSIFHYLLPPLQYFSLGAVLAGLPHIASRSIASLRLLVLDMNTLVLTSVIGACALGSDVEAGSVVFLFLLAQYLEGSVSSIGPPRRLTVLRQTARANAPPPSPRWQAHGSLENLMALSPQTAVLAPVAAPAAAGPCAGPCDGALPSPAPRNSCSLPSKAQCSGGTPSDAKDACASHHKPVHSDALSCWKSGLALEHADLPAEAVLVKSKCCMEGTACASSNAQPLLGRTESEGTPVEPDASGQGACCAGGVDKLKECASLVRSLPESPLLCTPSEPGLVVPVEQVPVGTLLAVRPGELVPIDGVVYRGRSSVDESTLTGEASPVPKSPGSLVWSGTLNCHGYLEVRTTQLASDSAVARMLRLVEESHTQRSQSERIVDAFSKVYTPAVVAAAAMLAILPTVLGVADPYHFVYMALVLMVAACPCSLVISTPIVSVCGITRAARGGTLVKGGAHLETLGRVDIVALDKTGTLTQGKFGVRHVALLDDTEATLEDPPKALQSSKSLAPSLLSEIDTGGPLQAVQGAGLQGVTNMAQRRAHAPRPADLCPDAAQETKLREVLQLVASVEQQASHPIARALVEYAQRKYGVGPSADVAGFEMLEGEGVTALVEGTRVHVGNLAMAQRFGWTGAHETAVRTAQQWVGEGATVVWVGVGGAPVALLSVSDRVREEASSALGLLVHGMGIQAAMLTGDTLSAGEAIHKQIGVPMAVHAALLPKDKVALVHSLRTAGCPAERCASTFLDPRGKASAQLHCAETTSGRANVTDIEHGVRGPQTGAQLVPVAPAWADGGSEPVLWGAASLASVQAALQSAFSTCAGRGFQRIANDPLLDEVQKERLGSVHLDCPLAELPGWQLSCKGFFHGARSWGLASRHHVVAMVGDGVNDTPALAAADVGIAMGAAGSAAAMEVADVSLMASDLCQLGRAIELGRACRAKVYQNVAVSVTVKALVLALAFSGYASLWLAIVADMGTTLVVIFNSLRILHWRHSGADEKEVGGRDER